MLGDRKPLPHDERQELIARLSERYGKARTLRARLFYFRKRYSWMLVVNGAKIFKRSIDTVVALTALVLLIPVFILITLLIKGTDGGSVLYIARRVGRWGKEFSFPKFRSMKVNADQIKIELTSQNQYGADSITFKMKKDPRITWIGRILRRTSLDELPQLWCVLKGEMSLVGPRPPIPEEVALYDLAQRRRLDVLPGLTGLWQVSGRSELTFDQQVTLDIEYIRSRSLWYDLKILLRTIPAVLMGKGAY